MFVNINVHSYYTLLESLLSIKDIVNFAIKQGSGVAVLTDVNNFYGALEFFRECNKNEIKPVIGLEVVIDGGCYVFIAKNNDGYLELVDLSSQVLSQQFSLQSLLFTKNQNVFAIHKSGSELNLGCVVYDFNQAKPNRIAAHTAKLHYANDFGFLRVLKAIQNNVPLDYVQDDKIEKIDFSLWTEKQAKAVFDQVALNNLEELIKQCQIDLNQIRAPRLVFPLPQGQSNVEFLKSLCIKNLKEFGIDLSKKEFENYKTRLAYEMSVLERFSLIDYFLVVWDLTNYAHQQKILTGPGRGSASGSMIAYALKITAIDPIKNHLIFERFLNPQRITMPDIDIDVMDIRREELFSYLRQKYGANNVAVISTFQHIKAKMAIRDAGRILKINLREIDLITKSLPYDERPLLEIVNSNNLLMDKSNEFPDLFRIAYKLIGLPRQIGTHAAGVVIANHELKNYVPVLINQNDYLQTQFTYQFLEECGLIKIDLLGLKNLSIVDDVLNKSIKSDLPNWDQLRQFPLDDPSTMKMLSLGLTLGIFQLESTPMTTLMKRIRPKAIEDISMIISLYRPGPMDNIEKFIDNAKNPKKINVVSEHLRDLLLPTNGIIIYQEQIIEIVQRVAKFSSAKADIFRRAISKKNANVINQLKNDFIKQGVINGFDLKTTENIFRYIAKFADYGFNHSHAFSYALLSYWMAYLKFYYPAQFFCTLFNFSGIPNNNGNKFFRELDFFKLRFLLPSINSSSDKMVVENNAIRLGLGSIKGVTSLVVKKILTKRSQMPDQKFNNFKHLLVSFLEMNVDISVVNQLIYSGALSEFKIAKKDCLAICEEIYKRTVKSYVNHNMIDDVFSVFQYSEVNADEFIDKQNELLGIDNQFIITDSSQKR